MKVVMIGPPGAGKGTQAKKLADRFDMRHLSSGDILRAERSSGTALGNKVAEYMDAGKLVPDDIMVDVMAKTLTSGGDRVLLDGFPRTVLQAEALDSRLQESGQSLDAVIIIDAAQDVIVDRITGRRICPACGKVYHVKNMPPEKPGICDACGEKLVQRQDDTEEAVKKRLEAYKNLTAPVVKYYRSSSEGDNNGLRIIEVDGNKPPEDVGRELLAELESLESSE